MSFYKLDDGLLLEGPNAVYAPTFILLKEYKDTYEYPVEGWVWMDTEEQARAFFGLPPSEAANVGS